MLSAVQLLRLSDGVGNGDRVSLFGIVSLRRSRDVGPEW